MSHLIRTGGAIVPLVEDVEALEPIIRAIGPQHEKDWFAKMASKFVLEKYVEEDREFFWGLKI